MLPLDLGTLHPAWSGWTLERDGELTPPHTWRRGFAPEQVLSWFWTVQAVGPLQREVKVLTLALQRAEGEIEALTRRCWWYRHQVQAQARAGWLLVHLDRPRSSRPGPAGAP